MGFEAPLSGALNPTTLPASWITMPSVHAHPEAPADVLNSSPCLLCSGFSLQH